MDAQLANTIEQHLALMGMVVVLVYTKLTMMTLKSMAREKRKL